jgi:hypothetical protein
MSRIYWHTRDHGTVEMLGRERAYMGVLVADLATSFLPTFYTDHTNARIVPELYGRSPERETIALRMRVGFSGEGTLLDEYGKPLDDFEMLLNTVLRIGNDAVCLMTRIHAQCEMHAYVEGHHRAWLADTIDAGRELEVMRAGMGWESLSAFLRERDDAPVVSSYSVCDGFPEGLLDGSEMENEDLGDGVRWDRAIARLREGNSRGDLRELTPENLRRPFGHNRHLLGFFD